MAIQRSDPIRDLVGLQERMNRLFDEALARSGGPGGTEALAAGGFRPPVDLFEEATRFVVRADLPGVASKDVAIEVSGDDLVLKGERRGDAGPGRESYLRAERPQGPFALRISLPPSVDRLKIEASHRDGVIEVSLPKKQASEAGRVKIEVR